MTRLEELSKCIKKLSADAVNTLLDDVSEPDETLVLECYKGKIFPETIGCEACKYGGKAQKRGISSVDVCTSFGI